jgi:hypothetical protein
MSAEGQHDTPTHQRRTELPTPEGAVVSSPPAIRGHETTQPAGCSASVLTVRPTTRLVGSRWGSKTLGYEVVERPGYAAGAVLF